MQLARREDRDLPKRRAQIVVVENPDVRHDTDRRAQVGERARVAGDELIRRHVVTALGDAHGDAFLGNLRAGNSDETEHHVVAVAGRFLQERKFVAHRIGEHGFKHAWDFGDDDYSVDNSATTTHAFAAAGEYYVEVTVSDMKGGVARDSIIVNVGSAATFSISGRVLNPDGKPLSGIRVSTSSSRYAFSESDGSYTITRLTAGNYPVTAIDPVADAYTFANPFFNNPVTVGPDATSVDFIVSTNPPAIITPIITANSSWKYLDNGSNQGTTWTAPAFNDATWATGNGVLGYTDGNDQIDTTISFGASKQ